MSTTELQTIEKRALKLNIQEREVLANHLFQSIHNKKVNEIDSAWLTEAESRYREYIKDPSISINQKKIFDDIKTELQWK